MTPVAPPELRFLICGQAVTGEGGNPDDLQNINTYPLPNGCVAYVNGQRAAYVLDKFSSVAADGSTVFAPAAGPGRWQLLVASSVGAPPVMAYNTTGNSNGFAVDAAFHQSTGSSFLANEGLEVARWTFTASGCVLTWNGPALPMLVMLTATLEVGNADAARTVTGFVSVNDEAPAVTNGGIEGKGSIVFNHANAAEQFATQRFITSLASGSTLRPKFAGPAAATTLLMDSTQLIVMPL